MTTAGPFLRYYLSNGNVVPFIEAEATFGSIKYSLDSNYSDGDSKTNLTLTFAGGFAFFINDFISIDLLAGYHSLYTKDQDSGNDDKTTFSNIGLTVGFTATF